METTDINLRGVPSELKRLLKVDAAKEGISLKELCLNRLAVSPAQVSVVLRHGGDKQK